MTPRLSQAADLEGSLAGIRSVVKVANRDVTHSLEIVTSTALIPFCRSFTPSLSLTTLQSFGFVCQILVESVLQTCTIEYEATAGLCCAFACGPCTSGRAVSMSGSGVRALEEHRSGSWDLEVLRAEGQELGCNATRTV